MPPEGSWGDVPPSRFARRSVTLARRRPEIAKDGILGELRPPRDIGRIASPDALLGFVAAVPREVEMPVGVEQRDEQSPLVKRACFLVPRDVFRPSLNAFVHNLAEDDELDSREQSRQLPVRFGEVRKDWLQGEGFHRVGLAEFPTPFCNLHANAKTGRKRSFPAPVCSDFAQKVKNLS